MNELSSETIYAIQYKLEDWLKDYFGFDRDYLNEVIDTVIYRCENEISRDISKDDIERGFYNQEIMEFAFQKLLSIAYHLTGKQSLYSLFKMADDIILDTLYSLIEIIINNTKIVPDYMRRVIIIRQGKDRWLFNNRGGLEDAILDFLDDFTEYGVVTNGHGDLELTTRNGKGDGVISPLNIDKE